MASDWIRDPSWVRANGLRLGHLEGLVARLETDEAVAVQRIIEEDAQALAAQHPGRIARPSPEQTVTVYGVTVLVWEVEQPRSALTRASRLWLVSTDGMQTLITRTR